VDLSNLKYLIVGAGFFGSVLAERIANDLREKVLVIDKYPHPGGNCASGIDPETGIEFHKFGTHIFHTSCEKVWNYIGSYTAFNGYRHQVLSMVGGKVYQMPINLETINSFYGINLRPFEVDAFLRKEIEKEKILEPRNLEEKAVSLIGRPLYEAFIRGYTEKQWQKDCKLLPPSIIERLPVRKNYDENYFFDPWQGIPREGYNRIFEHLLDNERIEFMSEVDFFAIRGQVPSSCMIIYSGPIDRFFDYQFGRLEWRTLEFEREVLPVEDFQGTSVMNYPERSVPYIRIHEPRHLHPERRYPPDKTLIMREYPKTDDGEHPYYPVNTTDNQEKLKKYLAEREKVPQVLFGGRLGDYKYYDMDQVIGAALNLYEEKVKNRRDVHV